jgi:hypothetical protein
VARTKGKPPGTDLAVRERPGSSNSNSAPFAQSDPKTQCTNGRAGNARCCVNCGRPINPKYGSRRQRYCSYRCRDEARRARNFAVSATTRRGSPAIPRSVENRPLASTACGGDFADRAFSISAPPNVIATEIVAGRDWRSIVSPDGVFCKVASIGNRNRKGTQTMSDVCAGGGADHHDQ